MNTPKGRPKSQSDTPETDVNLEIWLCETNLRLGDGGNVSGNVVDAEFARKLERERDQRQLVIEELRGMFHSTSIQLEECHKRSKEIKKERNELRNAILVAHISHSKLLDTLGDHIAINHSKP